MIILIAEAKTIEKGQLEIPPDVYSTGKPIYENEANEIMRRICDLPLIEIASTLKVSERMAVSLKEMAYEFPNKALGLRAIEAFNGVVFKHLEYSSMSGETRESVDSNVGIISSLYGWLRPTDIIKPYRMEFGALLAPDDNTLSTFWRQKVTVALVNALRAGGESEILNLLPAEAAKCIDWKLVKRFAKVRKVDFMEVNGRSVRSPHAGRLKALRGQFLRNILEAGLTSLESIKTFSTDEFLAVEPRFADRIAFMV